MSRLNSKAVEVKEAKNDYYWTIECQPKLAGCLGRITGCFPNLQAVLIWVMAYSTVVWKVLSVGFIEMAFVEQSMWHLFGYLHAVFRRKERTGWVTSPTARTLVNADYTRSQYGAVTI